MKRKRVTEDRNCYTKAYLKYLHYQNVALPITCKTKPQLSLWLTKFAFVCNIYLLSVFNNYNVKENTEHSSGILKLQC